MMMTWLKRRKPHTGQKAVALDANGEALHEIDVVTLLNDVQCDVDSGWPNAFSGTIPAGTSGTIILLMPDGELDVEFSVSGKAAFAHVDPKQVRLLRRAG